MDRKAKSTNTLLKLLLKTNKNLFHQKREQDNSGLQMNKNRRAANLAAPRVGVNKKEKEEM